MLVHQHRTNTSVVIDFRETVPESASNSRLVSNPNQAWLGRGSVGVPGTVAGLFHAHKKYGSGKVGALDCCSWSRLIYRVVSESVRNGVELSKGLATAIQTKITHQQLQQPDAANLKRFVEEVNASGASGRISPHSLQNIIHTLEELATNGTDGFYQGKIADQIVNATGGMLNKEDLKGYQVEEREVISTQIDKYMVMTSPAPTSGPKLLAFLNAMEARRNANDSTFLKDATDWLVDLQGHQLGLGDPKGNPEVGPRTHWMINKANLEKIGGPRAEWSVLEYALGGEPVASGVSAMDVQDNYVAVVNSANTWFGSNIMTEGGVLLNNALSNFHTPDEESAALDASHATANTMAFGQRPLTRNLVALAMDTHDICGSRYLFGGASADSVGLVMSSTLLLGREDMKAAIKRARLLWRNQTLYFEDAIQDTEMDQFTHLKRKSEPLELPYSGVNGIVKTIDKVMAYSDPRNSRDFPDSQEFPDFPNPQEKFN